MKHLLTVTAALTIAGPALAQATAPAAPAAPPAEAAAPADRAEATGQVKSVDVKAGTVTIHHGPISALGWPAMTMTFSASPEAIQAAKPGQMVSFVLKTPENRVVAIQPR